MNKTLDERVLRILTFIESKGGAAVVSRTIGKHPQAIYNIEQGKGKPNFETLSLLKEAYYDLDLNWVFTGEKSLQAKSATNERDIEYLKQENKLLRIFLREKGVDLDI
ncbi:transcriptional regulator with XRE-family HTH domain [Runella defluvii]|uniref:Transcriptional regulator with XRE-family HTH domain n=1 Tax=Runella defluvii TaxID=370973 RepID=A0A7W5ZKA0_9BACT|nr:helix-turn-helix transcriptional regulator [Runella defluvii]MBB3838433.1 transcriptional regulator with XRE-family HTH domain [Runella defluvii]